MEYKKNWEIFVESWSWFPLLICRPIEKDPEFLPEYILLRHIFIFSFIFIYMQLEHFLWHILNHNKRTLLLTFKIILKNLLLTRLLQDTAYRFILKIFITKGLRYSWWSDWSYSTLRLTLQQVHYLEKWGKTVSLNSRLTVTDFIKVISSAVSTGSWTDLNTENMKPNIEEVVTPQD